MTQRQLKLLLRGGLEKYAMPPASIMRAPANTPPPAPKPAAAPAKQPETYRGMTIQDADARARQQMWNSVKGFFGGGGASTATNQPPRQPQQTSTPLVSPQQTLSLKSPPAAAPATPPATPPATLSLARSGTPAPQLAAAPTPPQPGAAVTPAGAMNAQPGNNSVFNDSFGTPGFRFNMTGGLASAPTPPAPQNTPSPTLSLANPAAAPAPAAPAPPTQTASLANPGQQAGAQLVTSGGTTPNAPTGQPNSQPPVQQPPNAVQMAMGQQAKPQASAVPRQKMDSTAQATFAADLQKLPPEQAQAKAKEGVRAHFEAQPPEVKKGLQDLSAGKTDTPEAKQFQAQVEGPVKEQYVKEEYAKQTAGNPNVPPQQAGGMLSGIMDSWNKMPEPMKWMMGIGLGAGLLGTVSSLFGEGGMGMGLLGILGLGAAGLAGAGGGMFGQGAQTAVADGMFNLGQATGMIPKVDPKDMAVLRAKDPLSALRDQAGGAIGTREEVAAQLERAQGQVSSLRRLQMLPANMQAHFLRRMDPSMSEEDAQRAVQNAGTILQAYDNPDSELSQLRQKGEGYAKSTGASGFLQEHVGRHLMNAGNTVSNWWNGKQGSDMNIATKLAYQYMTTKAARCWAGYEPVPGAKAYSRGSCRPVGSKKTQKEMKSGKERHHETTKQSGAKSRTQSQAENQNRAKVRNAG